jgi:O-acetylhomoserine/O-acetylserine sulfhydrylase-like pyridoxal-dependent enzyme
VESGNIRREIRKAERRLQVFQFHLVAQGAGRLLDGQGFGGVVAFALNGDAELQNRFVAELRVITSAVSLGHDESLIVHVGPDGPRATRWPSEFRRFGHLRLSVGLEEPGDLLVDLDAALAASQRRRCSGLADTHDGNLDR